MGMEIGEHNPIVGKNNKRIDRVYSTFKIFRFVTCFIVISGMMIAALGKSTKRIRSFSAMDSSLALVLMGVISMRGLFLLMPMGRFALLSQYGKFEISPFEYRRQFTFPTNVAMPWFIRMRQS